MKGWYVYYWTFNPKRIKFLMISMKKERLENLKERLQREKNTQFFLCESNCIRLDFEQAMCFEFKCPECGSLMNQENNAGKIDSITEEIKKLEKEI